MNRRHLLLLLVLLLGCIFGQQAQARHYEPNSGRFLSPAPPLGHAASTDLYSLGAGDAVNNVDPTGRCSNSSSNTSSWNRGNIDEYTALNGYGESAFKGTLDEQMEAKRSAEAANEAGYRFVFSLPVASTIRAAFEFGSGKDIFTGRRVEGGDAFLNLMDAAMSDAAMILPVGGVSRGAAGVAQSTLTREARAGVMGVSAKRVTADIATAPHSGLVDAIQRGIDVPIPQGTTGIRTMMADISATTGNEVGLLRMTDGSRVMRLGGPDFVSLGENVQRLIAHTHPSGDLRLPPADIRALSRRNQQSTVLINPQDAYGVRKSASGSW